ncbi:MAG: hypothetical protein ACFFB2_03285 [Promethearchaeota archaeon]
MPKNNTERSELDPDEPIDRKKNRIKLDPSMLAQWWIETEEQIREAHPHVSSVNREELTHKIMKQQIQKFEENNKKRQTLTDSQIAKWYQNKLSQIRKIYPEKPLKEQKRIATKKVKNKIEKLRKEPQRPSNKQIAEWLQQILLQLREEQPHKPLREREEIATEKLQEKIKVFQKILPLDEFLFKELK